MSASETKMVRRAGSRLPVRCHECSKAAPCGANLGTDHEQISTQNVGGPCWEDTGNGWGNNRRDLRCSGPRSGRGCSRGVLQREGAAILRQIEPRGNPWRDEVACRCWEPGGPACRKPAGLDTASTESSKPPESKAWWQLRRLSTGGARPTNATSANSACCLLTTWCAIIAMSSRSCVLPARSRNDAGLCWRQRSQLLKTRNVLAGHGRGLLQNFGQNLLNFSFPMLFKSSPPISFLPSSVFVFSFCPTLTKNLVLVVPLAGSL